MKKKSKPIFLSSPKILLSDTELLWIILEFKLGTKFKIYKI